MYKVPSIFCDFQCFWVQICILKADPNCQYKRSKSTRIYSGPKHFKLFTLISDSVVHNRIQIK
jgi:hypothetical protein